MKELNNDIKALLNAKYEVVELKDLRKVLLSGKFVMGADLSLENQHVAVTPQNAFVFSRKDRVLDCFTCRNVLGDPRKKDFYINREYHYSDDQIVTISWLQEYIDKFLAKNYDFFYVVSPEEFNSIHIPSVPIPHIIMHEARHWLYS